ncbi:MAG: thioredoxin family protein [Planctomycetes bacterium]|nr:thioredoxin family protein [Planctomycetota bacterium]
MACSRFVVSYTLLCMAGGLAAFAAATPRPESGDRSKTLWFKSYAEGMRFAKAHERPVLIKFSAVWCGWCKKLDEEVLAQAAIVDELRKFVCIKVDVDKNPHVARAYAARSLPRLLVVNTHDEIVGDWLGYREAGAFLSLIREIQAYTRTPMGTLTIPKDIPNTDLAAASAASDMSASVEPLGLVEQLGHREPAIRQKAMDRFASEGPDALPTLVSLLEHPYLGVRIAAWKCLAKRHATSVEFDPWAPQAQRAAAIGRLKGEVQPSAQPVLDR